MFWIASDWIQIIYRNNIIMRGSYRHFVLLSPWYCNRLVSLDFLQCSLCDIMSGISLKISQSPKSSFETRTSHSNAWRILEKLYFLNGGPLSYKFENRFAPRSRYTHFLWTGAGCFAIFCALRLPLRISRNGILSSITWCFWIVHEFYLTVRYKRTSSRTTEFGMCDGCAPRASLLLPL